MAKRYYWLKLKEDFFDDDTMQWIEEQPNGDKYELFYLKLCLKSIKSDGILIRNVGNMLIPYNTKKISDLTRTDIDTVRVAMELFKKLGLVQILENGEIYLSQLENMVGSESKWAKYKRKTPALENFQSDSNSAPKKLQAEKERELEKDKELDIERETKEKNLSLGTTEILNFIQEKACISLTSQFQSVSELVEKYEIQDIKEAISKSLSKGKKGVAILNYATGILRNWAVEGKEEQSGSTKQDFTEGKYKGFKPEPPKVAGEIDDTGLI